MVSSGIRRCQQVPPRPYIKLVSFLINILFIFTCLSWIFIAFSFRCKFTSFSVRSCSISMLDCDFTGLQFGVLSICEPEFPVELQDIWNKCSSELGTYVKTERDFYFFLKTCVICSSEHLYQHLCQMCLRSRLIF